VLLISIDTLTADRIACYGDPYVRTPFLDRLARSGLQVRDAIAPAPLTLPSHATLLTGVDPPRHGVRENGLFRLSPASVTVAERLGDRVDKLAVVGAFPLGARFGLDQGFDRYDDDFGPAAGPRQLPNERRAREVFALATEWLLDPGRRERPFVWTHVFDPHYLYEAPRPWGRCANTLTSPGQYEAEISYTDHELGRYLQRVGALDPDGDATVLVTADHGEGLGRHVELTHSVLVYDSTQRVPLLLAGPGVKPRLVHEQRRLVDVTPSILDAYGIPVPPDLPGDPLTAPSNLPEAWVETKHTELLRGWSPLYGIRTSRWKYIRAPRSELYDLVADPAEKVNRLADEPDVAAGFEALVAETLREAGETGPGSMDEETAERLRSLGYVASVTPGSGTSDPRLDPKDGVHVAVALFRGEQAYRDQNLVAAERFLLQALRIDPDVKDAHAFLAGTYHATGRYAQAADHAKRALELEPHLNEGPVQETLGESLIALGKRPEGLEHLRAALELMPRDERLQQRVSEVEKQLP
jgi:arylsulfatase A-like enzyme